MDILKTLPHNISSYPLDIFLSYKTDIQCQELPIELLPYLDNNKKYNNMTRQEG